MTNHKHQELATNRSPFGSNGGDIRRDDGTSMSPKERNKFPLIQTAAACDQREAGLTPRPPLPTKTGQLRQPLRLLAAVATSAVLASCAVLDPKQAWHDEPFSLLKGDGDLVKIYHTQPGAAAMNENDVFASVLADSSAWYTVKQAKSIKGERDAFIKQGRMDSWYKEFRSEVKKYPRTKLVAFMIGVRIDQYQMSSKQFPICIDTVESCDQRAVANSLAARAAVLPSPGGDQHHLVRSAGPYTLYVTVPNNRTMFSLGIDRDRDLEAYLASKGRHPLAFGIARIQSVEENGSHGRHVINASLEGIVVKSTEFVPGETPDYYWMGPAKLDLHL